MRLPAPLRLSPLSSQAPSHFSLPSRPVPWGRPVNNRGSREPLAAPPAPSTLTQNPVRGSPSSPPSPLRSRLLLPSPRIPPLRPHTSFLTPHQSLQKPGNWPQIMVLLRVAGPLGTASTSLPGCTSLPAETMGPPMKERRQPDDQDPIKEMIARRRRDSSHSPRSSRGCFSSILLLLMLGACLVFMYFFGPGNWRR